MGIRVFLRSCVCLGVVFIPQLSFADLCRSSVSSGDLRRGYFSNRLIVKMQPGRFPDAQWKFGSNRVDEKLAQARISKLKAFVNLQEKPHLRESALARYHIIELDSASNLPQLRKELAENSDVFEIVELDPIVRAADYSPNDQLFGWQWSLRNEGQKIPYSNYGIKDADIDWVGAIDILRFELDQTRIADRRSVVAVIDSGVGPHSQVDPYLLPGWNTYSNGPETFDDIDHGTHVAGTIAASVDDKVGISGMNPHVRIMPIKVLCGGIGGAQHLAAGILFAAEKGAHIANMSLQFYQYSQLVQDAVNLASEMGMLLIAATGNNRGHDVAYPAKYENCMGVGATTNKDNHALFSNYGEEVDISAPGQDVLSLSINATRYRYMSGTSMATPHVSGAASILMLVNPNASLDEIESALVDTANDLGEAGKDWYFGWGRLDLYLAVRKLIECPADLYRDGKLDKLDWLMMMKLFESGNRTADLDANRLLDEFDLIEFIRQFEAGCS